MSTTTILFDLDGTLLPMDQEVFIKSYFKRLALKLAPCGYETQRLLDCIWKGTGAMILNDGRCTNEDVFWGVFVQYYGAESLKDQPVFDDFYHNEFQAVANDCGFNPEAGKAIKKLKEKGFRLVLATNPLFPAVATESRIRWAGLDKEAFELITTYENASYCKPNPEYYREILEKIGCSAEECLMVGNDVGDDMVAQTLGMKVFLLTDDLINKENVDISVYPNGSFAELMAYAETL